MMPTLSPWDALLPGAGDWLSTTPSRLVSVVDCLPMLTMNPLLSSVAFAAASDIPTTLGIVWTAGMWPLPSETFSRTVVSCATFVPAVGLWLATTPAASADATVTTLVWKPAPWRVEIADASDCPTTLGTATSGVGVVVVVGVVVGVNVVVGVGVVVGTGVVVGAEVVVVGGGGVGPGPDR